MKGFYRINTKATSTADFKYEKSNEKVSRRTGVSRLAEVEKTLEKQGIEFVEDIDGDITIVRYGEWANDVAWSQRSLL